MALKIKINITNTVKKKKNKLKYQYINYKHIKNICQNNIFLTKENNFYSEKHLKK